MDRIQIIFPNKKAVFIILFEMLLVFILILVKCDDTKTVLKLFQNVILCFLFLTFGSSSLTLRSLKNKTTLKIWEKVLEFFWKLSFFIAVFFVVIRLYVDNSISYLDVFFFVLPIIAYNNWVFCNNSITIIEGGIIEENKKQYNIDGGLKLFYSGRNLWIYIILPVFSSVGLLLSFLFGNSIVVSIALSFFLILTLIVIFYHYLTWRK